MFYSPTDPFPSVLIANTVTIAEHWGETFITLCSQVGNTFHLYPILNAQLHFSLDSVDKDCGFFWYFLIGQTQSDWGVLTLFPLLLTFKISLFFSSCRLPAYSQYSSQGSNYLCQVWNMPLHSFSHCLWYFNIFLSVFDLKSFQTLSTLKFLSNSFPAIFPNQSSQFIEVCFSDLKS